MISYIYDFFSHMATTLSSNGHEKSKETSKYKKLLILNRDPEKLPKQGEDSENL